MPNLRFASVNGRNPRGVTTTTSAAKHLCRHCSEFEFRFNTRHFNDDERTAMAIKKADGKCLYYAVSKTG